MKFQRDGSLEKRQKVVSLNQTLQSKASAFLHDSLKLRTRNLLMSIYAIGDTHLSFACEKPMDIFPGWQNHPERLRRNWNHLVEEDDTVVIPGDVSWAMDLEEAKADLHFLDELKGRKILLRGNHDYWWQTMKKLRQFKEEAGLSTIFFLSNNAYLVGGVAICGTRGWSRDEKDSAKILKREAGRLELSLKDAMQMGGEPIVFLHYPPFDDLGVIEEIHEVIRRYPVKRCYFGHLHNERTDRFRKFEYDGVNYSLISADFLEFCPKLIEK